MKQNISSEQHESRLLHSEDARWWAGASLGAWALAGVEGVSGVADRVPMLVDGTAAAGVIFGILAAGAELVYRTDTPSQQA